MTDLSFKCRCVRCFKILIAFGAVLLAVQNATAETHFQNCDRRPTVNGWLYLGDRNGGVWNDKGWMDIKPVKKVSRLFRQLQSPLKKGQKFFFEFDLMVTGKADIDQFYVGLMTPDGNDFNNFIGVYVNNNTFYPALVKNSGKGDMVKGVAKPLPAPLISRVAVEFDGVGKIKVRILDLLKNMAPMAESEVEINPDEVNFSLMTVFGIGIKPVKSAGTFRLDNLYFSDREPNGTVVMPSFMGSDLVKISCVMPFTGLKSVRVATEIESIIDADEVEIKGSILPENKLRGDEIWVGSLGTVKLVRGQKVTLEHEIGNLEPALWFPDSPKLYNMTLNVVFKDKVICTETVRFGFRVFEARDGRFYLNGRPIFLRGCSLNPPAEHVLEKIGQRPSFIRDYLRDLKLRNVNLIRMFSQDYKELKRWMEACDELGIMVFQGCYGVPPDGTGMQLPKDINLSIGKYLSHYFKNYVAHPSVVMYILANEVGRSGNERTLYDGWLNRVVKKLKKWNSSVAYMADSGVESCTAGDVSDYHFFAGWYYGSFLDYLKFRTPPAEGETRPVTLSECVGAFTTEKSGFPVHGRQIAAGLTWAGNDATNSKVALRYQAFLMRQSIEQFRRFREFNPYLAGIMPYTLLYSNWQRVRIFSEMRAKPAADQMRVSFQPILISWESWTPHVYAGTELNPVVHIINDSDSGEDLTRGTIYWEMVNSNGTTAVSGKVDVPLVKYYHSKSFSVNIKLDSKLESGTYRLRGSLKLGGRLVSSNETLVFVASRKMVTSNFEDNSALRIFDPSEKLKEALGKLGIKFAEVQNFSSLREGNVLVLGDGIDLAALQSEKDAIRKFIHDGGRLLVLFPSDELISFLGVNNIRTVPFESKDGVFINQAREDATIFRGLPESALFYWNDYQGWNETKPGLPLVSPVSQAMTFKSQSALKDAAVFANFGRGLSNLALVEIFAGNGSVLFSGFNFLPRVTIDPVSDRLLLNLITYSCSKKKHLKYPEVGNITWGDSNSERGVIVGPINGLVPAGVKTTVINGPLGSEYVGRGRELVGRFNFNSHGEVFPLGSDASSALALFWVILPPHKTRMMTVVRNPLRVPADIAIQLGASPFRRHKIPPLRTATVSTLIPHGLALENVVKYRGQRGLIIEKTFFE